MSSNRKPAVTGTRKGTEHSKWKPAAGAKAASKVASKSAVAKKSSAKAAVAEKPATSAEKKDLLKRLDAILPRLDEEGLAFLLEQARVHEYNMAIDRENRERSEALARGELFGEESGARSGHGKTKKPAHPGNRKPAAGLALEKSDDGNTFHFVCEGRYKLFNASEMTAMIKILTARVSRKEADANLLAWLERERRDALSDLGVSGAEFIAFLRSRLGKK